MTEEKEYLSRLPASLPADRVLVHNHVIPARRGGTRGFRYWLESPGCAEREVCDCGWAPEVGPHYRVTRHWNGDTKP